MFFFGKSSPTPPTSFTGEKKLAATAAWLAEPPSKRGFSLVGGLMESSSGGPTMGTIMLSYRVLVVFTKFRNESSKTFNIERPMPNDCSNRQFLGSSKL